MIAASDLETVSRAMLQLYSPELHVGTFVDHAFRFLSTLTSTDQINYGNLDPKAGAIDTATNCFTPDWHTAVVGFGEFMAKYPFFCFDPAVNEGEPFFVQDFISRRQFRDLDIFHDCFRILGMSQHCAVHVPTDDGRLMWFGVERAGRTNFTERDRQVLSIARQHLANAWRIAQARCHIRGEFQLAPATFCRAGFTPREAEVAYWLTEGKSNAEIATLLKVQLQTVKAHVTVLFNKTGIGNRLALTIHLLELGRTLLSTQKEWHRVRVRN